MNGREHKPQNICLSKPGDSGVGVGGAARRRNCDGISNLPDVSLKAPKEFLSLCLPNPLSTGSETHCSRGLWPLAGGATERPKSVGQGLGGWGKVFEFCFFPCLNYLGLPFEKWSSLR